MDDCSVMPVNQFVGHRLCVDIMRAFSVGGIHPPMGAAGESPEFYIKPPLWAPLLIVSRGALPTSIPQWDASAKQREIKSEFSLF